MNMPNWLNKDIVKASTNVNRWLMPKSEAAHWEMPDPQKYGNQADLYRKLSYIGTVVDIVSQACTDADFDVVDNEGVENEEHPLVKLFDKPNEYDSRTEFINTHYSWRKISGNSYWYLNRPSANVPPDELWILPPHKIIPVPDGRMGLRGYLYYPGNGSEIPLEPYEVLHFKSFNPFNRYIGLSAIESLGVTAYGALAAHEWNTRLFAENNARLPGILAFAEMINDSDWEKMKAEVATSAKKRNQMLLRGVGQGGVNWMQGAATQREMEFLAGLDRSMREIYDRLAPGLYNMLTANSSLANGETGLTSFGRFTITPLLRETTDKLNAELMSVYGEGWTAEYEDVTPEDKAMKMVEIEKYSQFHTIDEVRSDMYGNDPYPDPEVGKLLVSQVTAGAGSNDTSEVEQTSETMQPEEEPVEKPVVESEDLFDDEMKADLIRWRKKAVKNFGNPKALEFESKYITPDMSVFIRHGIKECTSKDEIDTVFANAIKTEKEEGVIKSLVVALEDAIKAVHNV